MPRLRLDVGIDFNNDADFHDTGEDVTARLRDLPGISIERGNDVLRPNPPPIAGESDLTLDNQSQDYSVEYASSPLVNNLEPGRRQRIRASVAADDFTRVDNASTLGSSEDGGAWSVYGASATFGVISNTAYCSAAGASNKAAAVRDSGVSDGVVQVTLSTFANGSRVAFRFTDVDNGFVFQGSGADYRLFRLEAGTYTDIGTYSLTPASGAVVRIEMDGSTIRVQVGANGVLSVTSSFNQTATQHGIGATGTTSRFDGFRVWRPMCLNYLEDLPQHPEDEQLSVGFPALGILSKLTPRDRGRDRLGFSTALYGDGTTSGGVRTDQALGYILDAIGLTDTALRVFDQGETVLQWFWLDPDADVWSVFMAVYNSEGPGGLLYEDGWGRIVFKKRSASDARITTSQATFRTSGAEPLFQGPFPYERALKHVINQCTVLHRDRAVAGSLTTVWQLGSTLNLGGNETRKFVVKASGNTPFKEAVAPVGGGTDYTVASGSISSATIDRTSGASVLLTITAGSSGASVTGLGMRAKLVDVTFETLVTSTIDAAASQARHGIQPWDLGSWAEIDINVQQDFCNAVVSQNKDPRPIVEVALNNGARERVVQALNREVGDRVTVIEPQTGLSAEMSVLALAHQILQGGREMRAGLRCRKAVAASAYFHFDSSLLDGSDVLGY